jgi:hypothetical protein
MQDVRAKVKQNMRGGRAKMPVGRAKAKQK